MKANLIHSALNTLGGHRVDGGRSIVLVEVTSTPMLETDTYGADETIRFTVTFNAAVDVTGDPVSTFSLANSGDSNYVNAAYESGTGTTELVFGYTVLSTDMDGNGIYQLGGETDFSTVKGPVGLDADDAIKFTGTSADAPLAYPVRAQRSGHKVDGSQTAGASSDATLSALTVTAGGTDLVTFASGTTDYTAMVASAVAEVTVTAETNDSGASVAYLDGSNVTLDDADTAADGHQVALAVGDTIIQVKVTAEDANATETYTVTVSRAEAASTCTLNTGDGDIWCGVVTVGEVSSPGGTIAYGFVSTTVGSLSDTALPVGMNNYTIDGVFAGAGVEAGRLRFSLTSALTDDDRAKLVLHIDGSSNTFAFSDASGPNPSFHYRWESTGLDWSSTGSVTVRLREATPPDAPTNFTATVGDTQVTLGWDAAASDSGVTGHEFRYKTDGDYPLTWTAIADSGPGETNEDSFMVTGLTNEVAHTFELRAVNTAGGGDAAEAGPVTPTPGICDRTEKIQEVILAEFADVDDCAAVTVANLASITSLGAFGLGTSNQGITSLQKGDFAGLTSLAILNLSRNTLTSLPEGIFAGLAELAELNLSEITLMSLPEGAFDGLVKLEDINLSTNNLTGIPEGAFSGLTALAVLYLSSNDLSSLPEDLFSGLTALEDLALIDNDLSSLPEDLFSGLTALTTLSLKDNDLSLLPETVFSGLTALTKLELDENELSMLPETVFSDLTALTKIELHYNALSSLPAGLFSGLTALERIFLENNALNSLPAGLFSGLTSLTTLTLQNNALSSLPAGLFSGLTSLSTLDLGGNSTNPMELTVTVEKVGTNQVRAKVLAGAPFAVDIPVTPVNGTLAGSVTELGVAQGSVDGTAVTVTRTAGTAAAATVDVDLTTQPTLPTNHFGYIFKKATVNLPATILPDATNAAPAFTSSATFNPAENQTAVDTVEAQDSDTTDDITGYALNGGADQALFSINNSGVLTFQAAPNYEDPQDAGTDNAYVVVVRATSGTGARVKTADQTITVTVMDEDEQPDRPDKPTVTAVSGSSTSLDVSWTEPGLNGGPEITGYQVRYENREIGTTTWSLNSWPHTGTTTTTTITGLEANQEYRVEVKALNGETPSDWSDPSDVVSTNAAVDSVLGFSETDPRRAVPENSAAGVNVGAPVTATPADSGDTLEYTLEGTDASSFDIVSTSGQIRTKSGVTYDYEEQSSYAVTVKASDGTDSATVDVTINLRDVDEQPDKPAKPTLAAVSGSATSLDASWTEPGRNGGPAITGYEVEYREGRSGSWVNFTHSGAGVTRTITGLRGNTEHQVRVRALNGETPSAWSDPSGAVRTNAATDAPTVASVAVKSAPQSGGAYGWGETIVFTVTFSQEVRVTGQPQPTLSFNLGGSTREARYSGITDTDLDSEPRPRPRPEGVKVHFHYTVQPGDVDSNGIQVGELASAIDLGGARIQNAADLVDADDHQVDGADAVLAHAALGRLSAHRVDGGTAQPPAGSGITIIDAFGNPLADNRLTLRESTRGRYGFKLNTRPTHTVWVAATASDGDPDLQVLPTANATMAITPDEWETPFYMELRAAIDDDEEIGERVFLNWSSSQDPAYHDLILPDVVVVEDERADDAGALSVADAEASETVDETLDFVVTLDRTPSRDWEATVDYRTKDGSAAAGSDYTMMNGTLTFAPGEEEKTVSVPIADDTVEDSGETLTLVLSNASGAGFASFGREAVGTIWNTETAATGTPTISGTPQVGETLTADTSGIADEDGLENVTFSYQWLAGDDAIAGATDNTYTLADAEEGKAIQVRVNFTDDTGHEETLTSEPTAVVAPKPNSPATGLPTISGTAQVGETLTADTSGIADEDGLDAVTFSYHWLADALDIPGATESTYTLAEAVEGQTVKVQVSFTDDGGNEETLTSAATEAVAGNEEPVAREDVAAWSATMTVEWVYQGYGYYSTDTKKAGSLSPASFEVDGTTYTVKMVETQGWWTYIGVDQELPFGFVLELDGMRFASGDASFASYSYGNIYRWEGTGLSLRDGDAVEVRLLRALEDDRAVNSTATGQPTISGTAQVGETLTADTSGIADADGLDERLVQLPVAGR